MLDVAVNLAPTTLLLVAMGLLPNSICKIDFIQSSIPLHPLQRLDLNAFIRAVMTSW